MFKFHEMKCAAAARLSEGRSPEFRSRRHMSPWNNKHVRFCEILVRFCFFNLRFLIIHNMRHDDFLQPVLIHLRDFHMQVLIREGVAFLGDLS